jgi:hypothetical protein
MNPHRPDVVRPGRGFRMQLLYRRKDDSGCVSPNLRKNSQLRRKRSMPVRWFTQPVAGKNMDT